MKQVLSCADILEASWNIVTFCHQTIYPFGNCALELQNDEMQNWPARVKTVTQEFLVLLETDQDISIGAFDY